MTKATCPPGGEGGGASEGFRPFQKSKFPSTNLILDARQISDNRKRQDKIGADS